MNAEQIAKLKELAQAALNHSEKIGEQEWYSHDENMNIFAPSLDLSYIAATTPQAVLELIEHHERVESAAKLYGETLQRIGNVIGLLAGNDLTVKALPRIEKLVEAERTTSPVSQMMELEKAAEAIYKLIPANTEGSPEDYPWQPGGNSHMQDLARRMARAALAAAAPHAQAPAAQVAEPVIDTAELATELERQWLAKTIAEVRAVMASLHEGPFRNGAETALDEIEARCGKPAAQPQPVAEQGELPPAEYDAAMDRHYLPLPGGWEIQTKGKGSTFRIAQAESGKRWLVLDEKLHEPLTAIARDARAAIAASQPSHDSDAAKRLRLICKLVGIESHVPADDETLWGAAFAVLGQIRAALEASQQAAEPVARIVSHEDFGAMGSRTVKAYKLAAPAPAHETITQQGGELVCTACGTTAALAGSQVQAAGDAHICGGDFGTQRTLVSAYSELVSYIDAKLAQERGRADSMEAARDDAVKAEYAAIARATAAEAKLEAIRQGVRECVGFGFDKDGQNWISRQQVLSLFQQQPQADECGLPG